MSTHKNKTVKFSKFEGFKFVIKHLLVDVNASNSIIGTSVLKALNCIILSLYVNIYTRYAGGLQHWDNS